jgi:transcriptional regulator with XRE-family HTH domain
MRWVVHYDALVDTNETLAATVRNERIQRGWSLDRAASRLGVSRRLLTQVEAGSANPSLSTLLSIANGFGIDLAQLISGTASTVDVVLQRDNASADVLWSTDAGSRAQLLVGKGPLELWSWHLEAGDTRRSAAHVAGSLEALVVTVGSIEIAVDGSETTPVSAGQSLIFAADRPHEYRNTSDRVAEFHLAVFDPIDDGGSR